MKVLELVAPSVLEVRERSVPAPGEGEVRVAVRLCGIGAADLDGTFGANERRQPPLVMGQEAGGVIDACGPGVDGWSIGERVTFDPMVWCGKCARCRENRTNLCELRCEIGGSAGGERRDGAFAECVLAPARVLHRLPDGMSFEEATLAVPLGAALHVVRRAGEVAGRSVVVVGLGVLGLFVVQALRRLGVAQVIVVDPEQERVDVACALGADEGCVPAMARGAFAADVVIAVDVSADSTALALASVRPGGRVVLVGCGVVDAVLPLRMLIAQELELAGACGVSGDLPEALAAIAAGEIRVRPLITAVFPLERGAQAFELARHPAAMKVLLRVGG